MPVDRAAAEIIRRTTASSRTVAAALDRQARHALFAADAHLAGSYARQLELVADGLERAVAGGEDALVERLWLWLGVAAGAVVGATAGPLLTDADLTREAAALAALARTTITMAAPVVVTPEPTVAPVNPAPPPPGAGLPPAPVVQTPFSPHATVVASAGTAGPEPGWYHAEGDPENTQRYWDGRAWAGGPQPATDPTGPGPAPSKKGLLDSLRRGHRDDE